MANGLASLDPGLSRTRALVGVGRGGPGAVLAVCKGTRPWLKTAKACEIAGTLPGTCTVETDSL